VAVSSIREACGYFKSPELNNKVSICSLAQQDMEQAYTTPYYDQVLCRTKFITLVSYRSFQRFGWWRRRIQTCDPYAGL